MAGQHTYCVQWPSSGSLAPRSLSLFKTCTFQLSWLLSHFDSMIIISCAHTVFAFLLVKTETTFLENKYLSQGWSDVFPPSSTMPLRILRPWRSTVFPPVCYGHHPPSRFCPCPPPIVGKHNPRAQMDWRQLVWSEHSEPAVRWAANSRQHFEVEVWCPASLVSFCTYCWVIAAARNR